MTSPETDTIRRIELRCPSQLRVLPHVRALARSIATGMGFCPEDVHKIELSVDEACSNAILHGYGCPEGRGGEITLVFAPSDRGLTVEVSDSGCGSPEGRPHVGVLSLEEYLSAEKPRGLGVYIMDRLMDEVRFIFPPSQGTQVMLVKRLPS